MKESWCRKVGGKGRRGISFAWRQHRFFFIDFSLLALSYEKLEETGKEKKEEEEEEWEHGGGVKLTEFASPQHCCCALFWTFTYGTYKERSPRCSIFPWAPHSLTSIYVVQRRNGPLPRTLLWYKLARFYGSSAPLRIFRSWESSLMLSTNHDSADYLTESIASCTDILLQFPH